MPARQFLTILIFGTFESFVSLIRVAVNVQKVFFVPCNSHNADEGLMFGKLCELARRRKSTWRAVLSPCVVRVFIVYVNKDKGKSSCTWCAKQRSLRYFFSVKPFGFLFVLVSFYTCIIVHSFSILFHYVFVFSNLLLVFLPCSIFSSNLEVLCNRWVPVINMYWISTTFQTKTVTCSRWR